MNFFCLKCKDVRLNEFREGLVYRTIKKEKIEVGDVGKEESEKKKKKSICPNHPVDPVLITLLD